MPSIFSSGVTQINILVGTIIASFQSGAVSYLYYADRVYQINLAIAGIAVGTVSLPVLSKAFKSKNFSKVSTIQNKSYRVKFIIFNTSKSRFNNCCRRNCKWIIRIWLFTHQMMLK